MCLCPDCEMVKSTHTLVEAAAALRAPGGCASAEGNVTRRTGSISLAASAYFDLTSTNTRRVHVRNEASLADLGKRPKVWL